MWRRRYGCAGMAGVIGILAVGLALTGCSQTREMREGKADVNAAGSSKTDSDKLKVVTTIFPYYDFVRQIAGEYVDISMIVPAGMDTHSFEPTAADMVTIGNADLLIYNGGEQETWVAKVIDASGNEKLFADSMLSYIDTDTEHDRGTVADADDSLEQEKALLEGDTPDEAHNHAGERDEHIWTSPENAQEIVAQIAKDLVKADPKHKEQYMENTQQYSEKLEKLNHKFEKIVSGAKNHYLIFGDRFPLKYFVEEYDLEYAAAFDGCGTETEPSADTIARLTDEMKSRNLPVVLKIELTSSKVADSIAESSHARVETFYTCHNVTKEQWKAGETYLSLMEKNMAVLKDALDAD